MPSFQCRELLTKGQVLKKEPTTRAEEPKKCAHQESDSTYHAKVLSHFACGRQRRMLLKAKADCILAKDTILVAAEVLGGYYRPGTDTWGALA